ncbi:hypothetical protein ACFO8Q_10025 [Effusibacillus consociatus]|uniref:Uncharacterized protein n=1 Tax=Effusibacillus consociatus TaxID=1117041 RepID=A0ABV9Q0W4_9BACL
MPNQQSLLAELSRKLDKIADLFGSYARDKTYFSVEEVAVELRKFLGGDRYSSENLASILVQSADNYDRMKRRHSNFYTRFITYNESRNRYTIQNSGYASFIDWIRTDTRYLLHESGATDDNDQAVEVYLPKVNPEIFLRINSRLQMERSLRDPHNYRNFILENVKMRHKISVAMLTYLFENEVSNDVFWELIEDYFLGRIPDEVLAEVRRSS